MRILTAEGPRNCLWRQIILALTGKMSHDEVLGAAVEGFSGEGAMQDMLALQQSILATFSQHLEPPSPSSHSWSDCIAPVITHLPHTRTGLFKVRGVEESVTMSQRQEREL